MPKPDLIKSFRELETEVIETLLAGLKEYRKDLAYPQSHSDMQGCVRALFRMYRIQRRPLALETKDIIEPEPKCDLCDGKVASIQEKKQLCYSHMKEQESKEH